MAYNFTAIEKKWQEYWDKNKTFRALDPDEAGDSPKAYVLDMFPYPSGAGLHVGHPEGYTATDIVSRYLRMRGFNVLHPMGWDAFGLPAEQYAIKTNTHPRETTEQNIQTFRRQIKMLGLSYDWDREVDTTDPGYYKWSQWIFLRLFNSYFDPVDNKARPIAHLINKLENENFVVAPDGEIKLNRVQEGMEAIAGDLRVERTWKELSAEERRETIDGQRLAYMDDVPVNWCPGLGTVLANEEVIDGRSEVGGFPVERRPMRQWMLRITAYAERLLKDLELLDWPDSLKEMQRNWIGKSVGAEVDFEIVTPSGEAGDADLSITVFTTRPDTLYGATYMVLAPEHPLVDRITPPERRESIEAYRTMVAGKSERDRVAETKDKTGVFTGGYAINPVNDAKIPIYVADYVLMGYGTGAIMAVPAHDQRDYEFARKFDLPIKPVVKPAKGDAPADRAFADEGIAVNSALIDGLPTDQAKDRITEILAREGNAARSVNYKLRDWLFSRQRYWGEPFPILFDEAGNALALPDDQLPLTLPEMADFKPTGTVEPPLSKAKDWLKVTIDGKTYTRETNVMPQWAGSCWYYLRYIDPHNDERFVSKEKEQYWMPVDLYVGGAEHAVLHLLYSRFWHKVLFDLGEVTTAEPFMRLVNQGIILGEDGQKMSKARGNVVNPDDIVRDYGADAFRLYEMYMGPLEAQKPWSTRDIVGMSRFLASVWRNLVSDDEEDRGSGSENASIASSPETRHPKPETRITDDAIPDALDRMMHRTIKKVGDDIAGLRFNTAIAELIKLNNEITGMKAVPRALAENLTLMLAPLAPHLAEELWARLGHTKSLARRPWPTFDPAKLAESTLELPVQVNGKLRDKISVAANADESTILQTAAAAAGVQQWIAGKSIRKQIYVPKKLVNFVVG